MTNELEDIMNQANEKYFAEGEAEAPEQADEEAAPGQEEPSAEEPNEEAPAPEGEESEQQETKADDEPPEHWAAEHKEKYRALKTDEERANFREMDKFFHQMHKRRVEEAVQPFKQAFEPYRDELANRNLTEVDAIKAMIEDQKHYQQFASKLQSDPVSVLEQLAERYGVQAFFDKDDSAIPAAQPFQLPDEIRQKLEKVDYLEKQVTQAQQSSVMTMIAEFENEKDANGNLAHPHYEKVYPKIIEYVKVQKANGRSPDKALLKEAYEYSVNAEPELRRAEIERQVQAELAKVNKERDVAKAKQAGRKLNGSAGASAIKPKDLNSVIEEANRHFFGA